MTEPVVTPAEAAAPLTDQEANDIKFFMDVLDNPARTFESLIPVQARSPIAYAEEILSSINPEAVRTSVRELRQAVASLNEDRDSPSVKTDEIYDVYLSIGGTSLSREFLTGVVSGQIYTYVKAREKYEKDPRMLKMLDKLYEDLNLPSGHMTDSVIEAWSMSSFAHDVCGFCNSSYDSSNTNMSAIGHLVDSIVKRYPTLERVYWNAGSFCRTREEGIDDAMSLISASCNPNRHFSDIMRKIVKPNITIARRDSPIATTNSSHIARVYSSTGANGDITWASAFAKTDEFIRVLADNAIIPEDLDAYHRAYNPEFHTKCLRDTGSRFHAIANFLEKNKTFFDIIRYNKLA